MRSQPLSISAYEACTQNSECASVEGAEDAGQVARCDELVDGVFAQKLTRGGVCVNGSEVVVTPDGRAADVTPQHSLDEAVIKLLVDEPRLAVRDEDGEGCVRQPNGGDALACADEHQHDSLPLSAGIRRAERRRVHALVPL